MSNKIPEFIDYCYNQNTKKNTDTLIVVTGPEGVGKSHCALHLVEYWLTKLNGECKEDDIKFVSLNINDFVKSLQNPIQYGCYMLDEAFELSSKASMSNTNKKISQLYMGIRGFNMFTILCIPSIWYLEGYFVKHRARFIIDVSKRGVINIYGKKQIELILAKNQYRMVKKISVVKPIHKQSISKYNGILSSIYEKKKMEKMTEMIRNLETIENFDGKKKDQEELDEQVSKAYELFGSKIASEQFHMSTNAVRYAHRRHQAKKRKEEGAQ